MKRQFTVSESTVDATALSQATRRGVLRGAGAGALALGGLSVGGTAAAQETSGKVVFVYDDGYKQDYTQTFPIHKQHDAPACVAVPSSAVGRNSQFMTEGQITEMTDAGWEVMSHGIAHESLGSANVTQDVSPEDTRVYVDNTVMGRTPNDAELYTGNNNKVVRKVTGKGEDDTGGYLTLDSKVGSSFSADATQIRFTEEVVRNVLKQSKQSLEERGFDVATFVYPYGHYDQRTEQLVKEYYKAVGNAYPGGINPGTALDPYQLRRQYFREDRMSEQELTDYLDRVASRNALGMLAGHTRNPNLTGERVQLAIELARERNLEIVTLQQALVDFGIYEETATPTARSGEGNRTSTADSSNGGGGDGGGIPFLSDFIEWLKSLFE